MPTLVRLKNLSRTRIVASHFEADSSVWRLHSHSLKYWVMSDEVCVPMQPRDDEIGDTFLPSGHIIINIWNDNAFVEDEKNLLHILSSEEAKAQSSLCGAFLTIQKIVYHTTKILSWALWVSLLLAFGLFGKNTSANIMFIGRASWSSTVFAGARATLAAFQKVVAALHFLKEIFWGLDEKFSDGGVMGEHYFFPNPAEMLVQINFVLGWTPFSFSFSTARWAAEETRRSLKSNWFA